MAIIPLPDQKRPAQRRPRIKLSRAAAGLLVFAVAVICFITYQILSSTSGSGQSGNLVQVGNSTDNTTPPESPDAPDSVPDGYQEYSNPTLGFSFIYPTTWGTLAPDGQASPVLSVVTPKITSYGLADALLVRVVKASKFAISADDLNVVIAPKLNSAGTYDWTITDKGQGKTPVGRPYDPQPTVAYQSGKATIYTFLHSKDSCTFKVHVFPVADNFVLIRMPSFCVSSKPGDDSVQASRKADFDNVSDTLLHSITVL